MARLTWQNVDAPSVSGASQALATAGQLFGAGSQNIADVFGGMSAKRTQAFDNAAIAALQQYATGSDFDRAVAERGLAGALGGINVGNLSADAMELLAGARAGLRGMDETASQTKYRDGVLTQQGLADIANINARTDQQRAETARYTGVGQQQAEAELAGTILRNTGIDLTNTGINLGNQITDYSFGRTKMSDAAQDQALKDKQAGEALALTMAQTYKGIGSADDAVSILTQDRSLTPAVRDAAIEAWKTNEQLYLNPSSMATQAVASNPMLEHINSGLTSSQRAFDESVAAVPGLSEYMRYQSALSQAGSAADFTSLMGAYQSLNGMQTAPGASDDAGKANAIASNTGDLTKNFNDLQKEFPNLSTAVISQVMQQNLDRGYFALGDWDKAIIDMPKVREILSKFDTPEERVMLGRMSEQNEKTDKERKQLVTRMNDLTKQYERALSDPSPQGQKEAARISFELGILNGQVNKFTRANPAVPSGSSGPAGASAPASSSKAPPASTLWWW